LLMWHGGGMTGVNWESTPDGRPGWQMFFLRAGFDTYVSDAVERGRASWAPYPQVYPEPPYFRTAKEAWEETFRFGPIGSWDSDPAKRRTHPGLRFPAADFETFLCQSVPRWGCNSTATQRAYDALLQRLQGGVILLTHSQGGNFGLTAALHAPDRVRAVISLEPSGALDPPKHDPRRLKCVPHLFLWGDYLDRHSFWVESRPASERWCDALRQTGCDVTWIELPALGIHASVIWRASHPAVGFWVTANHNICRRRWPRTRNANSCRKAIVGTTKRSMDAQLFGRMGEEDHAGCRHFDRRYVHAPRQPPSERVAEFRNDVHIRALHQCRA
jgi:pimeloyl-ACP methyl ester carboxylesterase